MFSFLFDTKTKTDKNEVLDLNYIEISIIDNNNLDKLLLKIKTKSNEKTNHISCNTNSL